MPTDSFSRPHDPSLPTLAGASVEGRAARDLILDALDELPNADECGTSPGAAKLLDQLTAGRRDSHAERDLGAAVRWALAADRRRASRCSSRVQPRRAGNRTNRVARRAARKAAASSAGSSDGDSSSGDGDDPPGDPRPIIYVSALADAHVALELVAAGIAAGLVYVEDRPGCPGMFDVRIVVAPGPREVERLERLRKTVASAATATGSTILDGARLVAGGAA